MGRITRWNDVRFEYTCEVYRDDNGILRQASDDACLPDFVQDIVLPDYGEIVLEGKSSGSYDSGRLYGSPEDCYPPEGSEDREFVFASFVVNHSPRSVDDKRIDIPLPTEVGKELFALWQSEIDALELPAIERIQGYD